MFLRMDEADCLRLLCAYQGEPVARLPDRFRYLRRLVAALAGSASLFLARRLKHPGGADTLEAALPLGGVLPADADRCPEAGHARGAWAFGLSW
jgi:hypothetical protein